MNTPTNSEALPPTTGSPSSDTPETDAATHLMQHAPNQWRAVVDAEFSEKLERERDKAMAREAAIIHFCEVEMGWEFFRAEYKISDNPRQSELNAMKLREFLSENH